MSFEELFGFLQFSTSTHNNQTQIDTEQLIKTANGFKEKVRRSLQSLEKEYEVFRLEKEGLKQSAKAIRKADPQSLP